MSPVDVYDSGVPDIEGNDSIMSDYLDTDETTTKVVIMSGLPPKSGGCRFDHSWEGRNPNPCAGSESLGGLATTVILGCNGLSIIPEHS